MPQCPNCGRAVPPNSQFCPYCGAAQSSSTTPATSAPPLSRYVIVQYKSPGIAVVLALVFGIFGLAGVGHIYVGKVSKGLSLIIIGVILGVLTWGSFITGFLTFGFGFVASAIFGLMLFVLCVWQIYDAYVLANLFNRRVQETGTAPW